LPGEKKKKENDREDFWFPPNVHRSGRERFLYVGRSILGAVRRRVSDFLLTDAEVGPGWCLIEKSPSFLGNQRMHESFRNSTQGVSRRQG
jgi:hypothetical protein